MYDQSKGTHCSPPVACFWCGADVDREAVLREPFWERFALRGCAPGGDGLPAGLAETAAANKEFTLHSVCMRGEEGTPVSASNAGSGTPPARAFTMGFRCGTAA